MPSLSDFSYGILVTVVVIYVCIFIYAYHHDKKKETLVMISEKPSDKYHKFDEELSDDMNKYNIEKIDRQSIENVVHGILEKKTAEKSLFWKLINSGKTGFMLGGLSGAITGGPSGALATGVVLGLVNPIIVVVNEFSTIPEDLNSSCRKNDREKVTQYLKGR